MSDTNYHFENDEVLGVLQGSDYLRARVKHALHFMTTGERWSLYRAIAALADKQSLATKDAEIARLREALKEIRDHHVKLNINARRPIGRSHTIALCDAALEAHNG